MAVTGQHESELLRGSIAKQVIRRSEVLILTTDQSNFENAQNIIVPVDGSQASFKALPTAVAMAVRFGADLTLYHVLQLHGSKTEYAPNAPHKSDLENIRKVLLTDLEKFLTESDIKIKLQKNQKGDIQLKHNGGKVERTINLVIVVEKGISAHSSIVEYAPDHAGMVVMTSHGRSGLAHMFLGSSTEKVVQHLELPVLVVKPKFVK